MCSNIKIIGAIKFKALSFIKYAYTLSVHPDTGSLYVEITENFEC